MRNQRCFQIPKLDLNQVRDAARTFLSWNMPLDGLLLNAGFFGGSYHQSVQGHEGTFAVNHLSHYLFVHLLTQKLTDTAKGKNNAI